MQRNLRESITRDCLNKTIAMKNFHKLSHYFEEILKIFCMLLASYILCDKCWYMHNVLRGQWASIIPQKWTAWTAHSLFFNSAIMKIASITIVSAVILATCEGMALWLTSVLFVLCLLYYWTLCKYLVDGFLSLRTTRQVDFFPARKPNFQSGDICSSLPTPISKIVNTGFLDLGLSTKLNVRKLFIYVESQIKLANGAIHLRCHGVICIRTKTTKHTIAWGCWTVYKCSSDICVFLLKMLKILHTFTKIVFSLE